MSNKFKITAILLLTLCFATSLSACKQTPEQQVESAVSNLISTLKNPSDEQYTEMFGSNSSKNAEAMKAVMLSSTKYIDYNIDNIIIDDDTAKAELNVTNKDIAYIMIEANLSYAKQLGRLNDNVSNGIIDEDVSYSEEALKELDSKINSPDFPTTRYDVTLDFKNIDGQWEYNGTLRNAYLVMSGSNSFTDAVKSLS